MSTRATIIVIDKDGNRTQFYHHCDGYPEWMGETLKSFWWTAYALHGYLSDYEDRLDELFSLMEKEKHFEKEELGILHGDIEYLWFVKIDEGGNFDIISYDEVGWDALTRDMLMKDVGDKIYCKF